MRVAVKYREDRHDLGDATPTGAFKDNAIQAPNTATESAMPISTGGSGTPSMPATAPACHDGRNITGNAKISGPTRKAPHKPTETMASM